MRQWVVGLCCLFCLSLLWAHSNYYFESAAQQAQFQGLLHELRCPVCQNQDLADSNAEVAADLRQEVYERVVAHQSDQEIMRYLTERYGDFILFKPPMTLLTSILWFGPLVLFILGIGLFIIFGIRRASYE
ncbi:MAG TPA: cytochrome c-type biogenesis protein [Legionellaceae bacterium]|nr:cytochrome c-type biogenesis protein [Legionellaceae bacterium]